MELSYEDLEGIEASVTDLDSSAYLYLRYSGRFMFGATCFGIVSSNPANAMAGLVMWAKDNGADTSEFTHDSRQDNMGMQFILYFPNVTVAQETADKWAEKEDVDA